MNISIEKIFTVNMYYHGYEVRQAVIKLTIQSLEGNEIYIVNTEGKLDLLSKQNGRVVFIVDSYEFPIPDYVNDIIITSNAENLAFQIGKQYDTISAPFTSICTIEDASLDEEKTVVIIETIAQMIDVYWDAVKGGIYES
ncbi:MAG: hypothetical protein ABSF14_23820 [Terriglobia bacterium]|jgi:hypothetical protein